MQCLLCSQEIYKDLYTRKKLLKRFLLTRYTHIFLRLKFEFLVRIALFLDVTRDENLTLSEFR